MKDVNTWIKKIVLWEYCLLEAMCFCSLSSMQSTALGSVSNNRNDTGSSASVPKAREPWSRGEVEKQVEGSILTSTSS